MRPTVALAALNLLLCPIAASPANAAPPIVHRPPREAREGSVQNHYGGTVTAITEDSITIQWTNTPGEKPKQFAASETLAAGKVPMEPRSRPGARFKYHVMPSEMYRLTDAKVGDSVMIVYARVNGTDICDHICIIQRPSGLIPPLPKEAEDLMDPKAILKARLSPDEFATVNPKFYEGYVPYHERWNAYWAKVAPMPHEVKPIGPRISQ